MGEEMAGTARGSRPAGEERSRYSGAPRPGKGNDSRTIQLAELWERTSARGARYYSGYLGGNQLLLFDGGEKDHPTRPGERVHVWKLVLQERDPGRRARA